MAILGTVVLAGALLWVARPASDTSAQSFVEGLNGPDAVNCFSQLRQLEDEKADAAIIAGTRHSSAKVRGQCARLLGERQDVTMVAYLTPMLSDPEPAVRNQAARSLLPLLDDEEMVQLLRSSQLSVGSQMVMLNSILRDPLALTNKDLLDWLLDRDHPTEARVGSYQALRSHHSPCFGEKRFEKERLPAVVTARQRILQQAIRDALDTHCPEDVRCAALPLYATLSGPAAYNKTVHFLQAPEPALREASLVALAATRDPRGWALFSQLALDTHQAPGLRVASLTGLRRLGRDLDKEKEAFPLFCQLSQNTQEPVEVRAAALGSLRIYRFNAEALRLARQGLAEKDPLVRQKAAQCLALLGDKNAAQGDPNYLDPSLELLQEALASETDPEAKCAMQGAVCNLHARLDSRGK